MTTDKGSKIIWYGVFVLITLAFIALKWEHLHLPYFWDESWVYAPAVKTLAHNGASIFPQALQHEFSRGHPLFFHFAGALWIHVFGEGLVSMHSFALTLSILLAFAVFFVTTQLSGKYGYGVLASLLLYVQGIYIAQSAMVLPEIMVALFTLLCIWFYLKHSWLMLAICLSAGLLTKESFIVVYAILAGTELLLSAKNILNKQFNFNYKKALSFIIPVCVIMGFFIIQHAAYGWYFYPTHIGMIKLDQWAVMWNIHVILKFLFFQQGRVALTVCTLLLSLLFMYKNRLWYLMVALLAFTFFLFFLVVKEKFSSNFFLPLAAIICAFGCLFGILKKWQTSNLFIRFSLLAMAFGMAYTLFSAPNFFSLRYTVCLFPLFIIYAVTVISKITTRQAYMEFALIVLLGAWCMYVNQHPKSISDVELSYKSTLKVQQDKVQYFEVHQYYHYPIYAPFLDQNNFNQPLSGFKSTNNIFEKIHGDYVPGNDSLLIFDNIEVDMKKDSILANGNFKLMQVFERGLARAEIYKRVGSANK